MLGAQAAAPQLQSVSVMNNHHGHEMLAMLAMLACI
jgi:hypothetical protein